jgi:hypothetical protein
MNGREVQAWQILWKPDLLACLITAGRFGLLYKWNVVRFQVLTAASVKFRVFWDVLPCSEVLTDRGSSHL